MQWIFQLKVAHQPRVELKIAQLVEHAMVELRSFSAVRLAHSTWITFLVQSNEVLATHLFKKLGGIFGFQSMQVFGEEEQTSEHTSIIKIWCDVEFRLPILQILSSAGGCALEVTPSWMSIEIRDPTDKIEYLSELLRAFGVIESFAKAALV